MSAATAVLGAVLWVAVAQADWVTNTLDNTIDSPPEVMALTVGGANGTTDLVVKNQNINGGDTTNSCNLQGSNTNLTVKVESSDTSVATVSPSPLTFADCDQPQTITVTPVGAGSATITATQTAYTGTGLMDTGPATFTVNVTGASNQNPKVKTAAADALGTEGDTLTTSGAFEDPDVGDSLTLSADNGTVGTFKDLGGGAWSWSLPTNDDVALGTITVTANDGKGGTISDSFDYSAANADPSIENLGLTGSNCDPVLGFDVSDPGTADTHTGTVDWGDGSTDTAFANADLPFSQSHHYGSARSYTIQVDVADDDGGPDSETLSHTVNNIPSNVLQPINYTGRPTNPSDMSLFKAGSTVPVKITVADCDGNSVGTLSPTITVNKYDNSADGDSVESTSPANPTPGNVMRYDVTAAQYIYNLGTKGFTNGDYKITINDPSFGAPVIAYISLKGK